MTAPVPTLELLDAKLAALQDSAVKAIAKLTTRIEALEPPAADTKAPLPSRWADRATPDDWRTLVAWVDDLNRSYSLTDPYRLHPCWPAHPGVVEELAAVHHAWIVATIEDTVTGPKPAVPAEPAHGKTPAKPAKPAQPAKGGTAYAVWHDRSLWPFLERIRGGLHRNAMCRAAHVPENPADLPKPTDTTLIPIAPEAAA